MQALNGMFDIKNEQFIPSLFTLSTVNDAKSLHAAMEVRYIYMCASHPKIRTFIAIDVLLLVHYRN